MGSPLPFEFATAARIVFGAGKLQELASAAKSFGTRALIITGRSRERSARAHELLTANQVSVQSYSVPGEPTVEDVRQATAFAKLHRSDLIVAIGGGSVMDTAKAVSALLTNEGDVLDYLEVIGRAQPLTNLAAPCITIPTTAGTGTEVTRNAVLSSPQHRFKVSLRSPLMLPRLALIDPELTYDLPRPITAATGLDALTQLVEAYVSHRANPLTDGFCVEGLQRVSRSIRPAYETGAVSARQDMALAALLSGLALANAGLGVVHGFAAPLGGVYSAPHGALCAALLCAGIEVNLSALRQRAPDSAALGRYTEVARLLTSNPAAVAEDGIHWLKGLCAALEVPPLRKYGVRQEDFSDLVAKASSASSMKANPIVLRPEELHQVLEQSW